MSFVKVCFKCAEVSTRELLSCHCSPRSAICVASVMWIPTAFIGFFSIINDPLWGQVKYGKAIMNVLIVENIPITLILPSCHHTADTSSLLLCIYVYENIVFYLLFCKNDINVRLCICLLLVFGEMKGCCFNIRYMHESYYTPCSIC